MFSEKTRNALTCYLVGKGGRGWFRRKDQNFEINGEPGVLLII